MSKNYGSIVSRVLEAENRNFSNVVFQQKRPPLDSEWNLVQDIILEKSSEIIKQTTPSGFLHISDIKTAPENRSELNSSWPNAIIFKNPFAIVNGWLIKVGAGTNQFQPNSQKNIWKELSNDENEVAVIGTESTHLGYREDLVFLEVWQKLITTSDTIYKYGFVQSALDPLENDLIDTNIEIETSKRVQIQYRIRWVNGVDFTSYRNGLGFPGCFARGPQLHENTNYVYRQHPTDIGLYIAGDGQQQSKTDLNTVDGFTYAIPIARVHRRNRLDYTLTNKNGALYSMLSGNLSDRPDKLYYDEIASQDVEDLRHKISLEGFDYNKLLEENLYLLWTKKLPSELKSSPLDENLIGNKLIQADGISTVVRSGINDEERDPDGIRRVFSESKEIQKISWTMENPLNNSGKLWFCPIGKQENNWEYELWNENLFFSSKIEPTVIIYDDTTNPTQISILSGGTWHGLGEFRTSSSIDTHIQPNKNKITYTPTNIALIENKKLVVIFDFVVREGGGTTLPVGGLTFSVEKMYSGFNEKDGRPIECNLYNSYFTPVELTNPRRVNSYFDSATSKSIYRYEQALIPTNHFDDFYRASSSELIYYKISDGTSIDTIDLELYGRTVLGIFSVVNKTSGLSLTPGIELTLSNYQITGLTADTGHILEYTILLGGYTIDYIPHVRGIKNIAKTYTFSNPIAVGDQEGMINAKKFDPECDGLLSCCGFYNGIEKKFIAYINNKMVYLSNVEGLGTPLIRYTLETPSAYSGQIDIKFLGYYNPDPTDKFYFQYQYIPYKGIVAERLTSSTTQKVRILKIDEKVSVITSGTGSVNQKVPPELLGMTEMLPMNKKLIDYNLFGEDIPCPISGGETSLRRIPGRALTSSNEHTYLKEGEIVEIMLGSGETSTARGAVINSPKIFENGAKFSPPIPASPLDPPLPPTDPNYDPRLDPESEKFDPLYDPVTRFNHLSQWTALVEGLDNLVGEIFLMVITTVSSVYNSSEGLIYKYLEQKDIYNDDALGKGSETILINTLTGTDLSQKLGGKIYGTVDLFPIKYRPIIHPTVQ